MDYPNDEYYSDEAYDTEATHGISLSDNLESDQNESYDGRLSDNEPPIRGNTHKSTPLPLAVSSSHTHSTPSHFKCIRGEHMGSLPSQSPHKHNSAPQPNPNRPHRIPYSRRDHRQRALEYQTVPNLLSEVESHNYEPDESEVWRAYVTQQHFRNRGQWWTTGKKRACQRWAMTFLIGVIQAVVAALCNFSTKRLSRMKYDAVNDLLERQMYAGMADDDGGGSGGSTAAGDDMVMNGDDVNPSSETQHSHAHTDIDYLHAFQSPFWTFLLYQLVFAACASLFVYIEPVSAGSGIPEIKCFLNGIDLPRIVRVKTLLCKVMGVTFSVAAGLPVGKEGPMVHSGAVVAAGISQGRTKFWGVDTSFSKYSDFRNDREKRDFVACGAAAGVASAFNAPIGGVLFSLEEGASYWSTRLTWRAFFCAMITLGTMFTIRNFDTAFGYAEIDKLFSFGEFNSLTGEHSNFSIWELLLFGVIGCLGGLIGACFNAANEALTLWRMAKVNHSKKRRFYEVLVVSLGVSILSYAMPYVWGRCTELPSDMQDWNNQEKNLYTEYAMPYVWGRCTELPSDMQDWNNQEKNLVEALVPFQCIPKKEYNEVASLIFTDADTAIKQLFHFRESGEDDSSTFSSAALFLFFFPYILMATVVYGIAVPSGLFVPSLLSGAAFGRLCGHLLHKLDHTSGTFADSGTYALMGAAAVLGGMARMTISLTVILLEATGDMQYVLPLMLTLMAARFTGNVFNEGLYDIHIKLRSIPFLEEEVPAIAERYEIVAGQVMSKTDVKCLRPVERAGVVYDLLRSCRHGTFPIVDTASGGTLYGTASRSMLCTLLQRRAFGDPGVLSESAYTPNDPDSPNNNGNNSDISRLGPKRLSPLVQWDTIERVFPRYPTIEDVEMRPNDRNCWLDLRPYANTAPFTVNETASIQRSYRLFRTLGLRQLCVVNHNNQVVGIITRKDLLPEALADSLIRGRNAQNRGENGNGEQGDTHEPDETESLPILS
eukprot:CAMPEP_0194446072 /NCGR_PEP_ID=MMETSP0176-20130528/128221_1 /TAXON_ID=216777 /ORGANISM="Proboscia alata, Strain PI-D3" /LENGTH=994 /DNA_ID=CAMNT_0039272717 /DNA_START=152 /DNA_END=3137 /DNA_ORIENTATION=-